MNPEVIFEAFDSVPRPRSNEIISQAYDREEAEFSKSLAKMTNRGVPEWFWNKFWHEITMLEDNATHYFLPSLLVSAANELNQPDSELKIVDALVDLLSNERRQAWLRSHMTAKQIETVSKVLDRLRPIAYLRDYSSVLQQWSPSGNNK